MKPTITAFERSPDRGRGLARDMRVRWALEEVGRQYEVRRAGLDKLIRMRLADLSYSLGDADWIAGDFSAADILMVTVLRRLGGSGLLEEHPNLPAYVARAEARPAYRRAFDAQLAVFTAGSGGS